MQLTRIKDIHHWQWTNWISLPPQYRVVQKVGSTQLSINHIKPANNAGFLSEFECQKAPHILQIGIRDVNDSVTQSADTGMGREDRQNDGPTLCICVNRSNYVHFNLRLLEHKFTQCCNRISDMENRRILNFRNWHKWQHVIHQRRLQKNCLCVFFSFISVI